MRGNYSAREFATPYVPAGPQPPAFTFAGLRAQELPAELREDGETIARLMERDRIDLPPTHFKALLEDIALIKGEDLGHTAEGAYTILCARIDGPSNLLRFTNTLVPAEHRVGIEEAA